GYLDTWLRERDLARTLRLISYSFVAAHTLVYDTGLIATLPSRHAKLESFNGALRVVPLPIDAPAFSLHLFWSERYDKDPVNKWLRDAVHGALSHA
ncbi:MAG: LysR substrate-binding domain-containing protein, partial [Pseudomonadota bacterium]